MHLIDLANNLWFSDLLETDDTTVVKIFEWLKANIGQLNNLISTSYVIESNDAFPELGYDEATIFAAIYIMNYYQRQQKVNMGASSYTDWTEVVEGDSRVRRVSRNEIAKNFRLLSNDIKEYLYQLSEHYRRWKCVPASLHSQFYCSLAKTLQQP